LGEAPKDLPIKVIVCGGAVITSYTPARRTASGVAAQHGASAGVRVRVPEACHLNPHAIIKKIKDVRTRLDCNVVMDFPGSRQRVEAHQGGMYLNFIF